MAKLVMGLGNLCEALGVEDPNRVTRVVVDIRAGCIPMLYVERLGDAAKIVAALSAPGIELRREPPAEVLHARLRGDWRRNLCGAEGGKATDNEKATCPDCRAAVEHKRSAEIPHQGTATQDGPVVHGSVSGNMAWGNGSVVQNGR